MNTLYLAWRQPDQRWWPVAPVTRRVRVRVHATRRARGRPRAPASDRSAASRTSIRSTSRRSSSRCSRIDCPLRAAPTTRTSSNGSTSSAGKRTPWSCLPEVEGSARPICSRSFRFQSRTRRVATGPRSSFTAYGTADPPQRRKFVTSVRAMRSRSKLEPANPHDPRALRIQTVVRGVHIGFVPRYLCQDVHALLSAAGDQAQARVQRVNPPPTPAQFRVLCSLDSPWPEGFRPLASPDFEALHAFVPAGRQ